MKKEEALNKIRQMRLPKETMEALETLIPELAESEDERMMREFNDWLCEEIECLTNDLRDEKDRRTLNMLCYVLTKVKDWLEKQKEQKPWKVGANAYFTPEQKPAESISQLTVQGKGVYKICPRCKERMVRDDSMVYTSMPPQYRYECPKCGESECDTVMYDNPEMEKQKPVVTHGETYHRVWNKEDEIMLKWIEDILLIADDDLNDKLNGKVSPITDSAYSSMKLCIAKCHNWLKSLRPSWKPSEEQLKYLLMLADYFESEGGTSNAKTLREFHEQLKKLM